MNPTPPSGRRRFLFVVRAHQRRGLPLAASAASVLATSAHHFGLFLTAAKNVRRRDSKNGQCGDIGLAMIDCVGHGATAPSRVAKTTQVTINNCTVPYMYTQVSFCRATTGKNRRSGSQPADSAAPLLFTTFFFSWCLLSKNLPLELVQHNNLLSMCLLIVVMLGELSHAINIRFLPYTADGHPQNSACPPWQAVNSVNPRVTPRDTTAVQ